MAENISGRDLTSFFNTWIYTTGKPAWQVKFNLNVVGPAGPLDAGSAADHTLTVRNTGKVAMPAPGTTVTFDASDILDDATIGTLPAGVTQSGTMLTWAVPATALSGTSSVTIPFTVNGVRGRRALRGNGTLNGVARAATLGSTCLTCSTTHVIGNGPIAPAVTSITGGTPTVGTPLTADTSGWAAGTAFSYQWLIDGTPVPGATSATYAPTVEAVGFTVGVRVTGTLSGSNPTTTTTTPTPVAVRATQPTGTLPSVSGTPKIGVPLTVNPGTWAPGTVFTYQWRANGTNIGTNGTGPTYTPAAASQVGQTLDVVVTGTKAGYNNFTKTSPATTAVVAGDPLVLTPTPVHSGTPKVGVAYTPTYGSWDDGVDADVPVGGQRRQHQRRHRRRVHPDRHAVRSDPRLSPSPARSRASRPSSGPATRARRSSRVRRRLQPTPTITGTPTPGVVSTGVPGTWDTGTTRTFQWYADGVAIPGAVATTYTPTNAQNGQVLTFEVTSTRPGYTTVTKTSPGKTIVGTLSNQTAPSISGTPTVGSS